MTLAQPILVDSPFTFGTRVREWLHDVIVLTRRNVVHIAREPMQLSDVTVQPILFTVLFTYVFGAGMSLPGGGSYKEFVLGGVLTLNLTTSTVGSAVGVSSDMKSGVIERFRTLPMSTTSVLVARTISDLVSGLLCAMLVTAAGLAVGWRPHTNVAGVVGAFAVVLLFSYAISWTSVCFGLAGSGPEAVQATAFIVLFPLSFISNAFVATQGMPRWLQAFADWEPGQRSGRCRARTLLESEPVGRGRRLADAASSSRVSPLVRGDHRHLGADRGVAPAPPHDQLRGSSPWPCQWAPGRAQRGRP